MDVRKLEKANEISKEISELESALRKINSYKGRGSEFTLVSMGVYEVDVKDKDTKFLVEELIAFRLAKKLEELKEQFENL